jgi:hypothetical protein
VSASSESVGDGLDWFGASYLMVEGVTVSNSARASVLIDGAVAAGSTIQSLALGGGDEQKGILQQNVTVDDTSPSVGTGVPSVRTSASEEFAIATPPAVPPGI